MKYSWESLFTELMSQRFQEIRAKNKRFSLRSFARMARISPGTMSLILKGSRVWSMSLERALESLQLVKIDISKINYFIVECAPPLLEDPKFNDIPNDAIFKQDRYYTPIFLAFGLSSPPPVSVLASLLNTSEDKIKRVVYDLLKRGYLIKTNGTIQRAPALPSPTSPPAQQNPPGVFEFKRLYITGSSAQTECMKKEVERFYKRIHAIMNASQQNNNEVFTLVVDIAPLGLSDAKRKVPDEHHGI